MNPKLRKPILRAAVSTFGFILLGLASAVADMITYSITDHTAQFWRSACMMFMGFSMVSLIVLFALIAIDVLGAND